MNRVKELFETEGLLDEFNMISGKNLMHVEDVIKLSRDAFIPKDTIIFGRINRLQLIKNKMKINASFVSNAICVDIRKLSEWVKEEIEALQAAEEPEPEPAELEERVDVDDSTEEIPEDIKEPESVSQGSTTFKYEYLVETIPISSIASGFTVIDNNPKELAYAFVKNLRAG